MPTLATLEIGFSEPFNPPLLRLSREWNGFSAKYVELGSNVPFDFRSRGQTHFVALHDIALRDGEPRVDGLAPVFTRDLRDTITFVPRGCGIEGWPHPEARSNSFVAMYFDPEALREDLGSRYARREPAPFAYARNPQLQGTLKKLQALVRASDVDGLLAESVCLLASLEIFGVLADPYGRLSDRQITVVTDYVENHLHELIRTRCPGKTQRV